MVSEQVREFFESLGDNVDPARLEGVTASYRFDVKGAGSWRVGIADGELQIAESDEDADCVIRASEKTLEKIARGEQNPATAVMLGRLEIEGDMALALKLKDLL